MSSTLFSKLPFGRTELANRVVMAPLTRSRAIGNVPNELMATYYGQRASAGLIITEGTSPSPNGLGYSRIPGLFSPEHVRGWRKTTERVHAQGGRIFVQIMHTGRITHGANLPVGGRVLAPSPIAATGTMWTDSLGPQPFPVPAEMTEAEIQSTIAEYVSASRAAIEAGFDGVELHAANGYLIDQFLNTGANQRTDQWGGSIKNRARFALEIARQVGHAIGFDRVGMRVSPYGVFNDMKPDAEMEPLYVYLAHELSKLGVLYLHLVDHSAMGAPAVPASIKHKLRENFAGLLILSGGYDAARAEADLIEGKGDLVAFGKPFISNPTLVEKLLQNAPLAVADATTFYTPGEQGYTDYA